MRCSFGGSFPKIISEITNAPVKSGELAIGNVHVYELHETYPLPQAVLTKYIVNFPTKNHWHGQSRIEDIESGLQSLVEAIEQYEIKSMAMPALGCGLGGLDYAEVKFLIDKAFVDLVSVEVLLFLPK